MNWEGIETHNTVFFLWEIAHFDREKCYPVAWQMAALVHLLPSKHILPDFPRHRLSSAKSGLSLFVVCPLLSKLISLRKATNKLHAKTNH